MKAVGILSVFIAVLFLAGPVPAAGQDRPVQLAPDAMHGLWEGEGLQTSGERWSIRATLEPGRYEIDYPSLSCGGTLVILEKTSGYLRALEKLTFGQKGCFDGGLVILVRTTPNEMDYLWYYPDGSRGAEGRLKRVR